MPTLLDGLRAVSVVVADTGDLDAIRRWRPQDCRTNPSLVLKAAAMPWAAGLIRAANRIATGPGPAAGPCTDDGVRPSRHPEPRRSAMALAERALHRAAGGRSRRFATGRGRDRTIRERSAAMAKIEGVRFPGMTGYIQVVGTPEDEDMPDLTRYRRGRFFGRDAERFELRAGDHWQGPRSSDARKHRERVEFRDETRVRVSRRAEWFRQTWDILIHSAEYTEMTPKQTHGQVFDEKNGYPILFMRRENGVQEILVNSKLRGGPAGVRLPVPFVVDAWNWYTLDVLPRPGPDAAAFRLSHNGRLVAEMHDISLIERDADHLYWKHGLYRSDMDDWAEAQGGAAAPTLVTYYSRVARLELYEGRAAAPGDQ